jgi:hypothetical protein
MQIISYKKKRGCKLSTGERYSLKQKSEYAGDCKISNQDGQDAKDPPRMNFLSELSSSNFPVIKKPLSTKKISTP